jgi:hypothetical protein
VDTEFTNEFTFEPGNVRLIVTHPITQEQIIGSVSADALMFASPVWKKFLLPPWEANSALELTSPEERPRKISKLKVDTQKVNRIQSLRSRPEALSPKPSAKRSSFTSSAQQREIDCSEDDVDALLILLNIAHLRFGKVPTRQIKAKVFHNLAVLCGQYDCVQLVKPWLALWLRGMPGLADRFFRPGSIEDARIVFIFWVFGMDEQFQTWAMDLMRQATMENGQCCIFGERFPEPIPPGLIGKFITKPLSKHFSLS